MMMITRSDITFTIMFFSHFTINFTLEHVSEIKHIFCYLADIMNYNIIFNLNQLEHNNLYSSVKYVNSD